MNRPSGQEDSATDGLNERSFWLSVCGALVIALCCAWSADLFGAWRDSPLDRFGWLPLLIWIAPLIQLAVNRDPRLRLDARRTPLLVAAVACGSLGSLTSLNVLQHMGLILACSAWLGWSWSTFVWAASGIGWVPAFGWVAAKAGAGGAVLLLRVLSSGVGAAVLLRSRGRETCSMRAPSWVGWTALASALGASLIWQFVPLHGAEQRLIELQIQGDHFNSRGVALSATESTSLGAAIAVRRLYTFGDQRILANLIDATHNRHAVHDPLYCFTGSGWQIVNDRRVEIPGGEGRHVTFARQGQRAELTFWFSDGAVRHCGIANYWWQTTLRRLTCGLSGPEPVLVLLQSYDDRPVDWRVILRPDSPLFSL